uniref:F-box domain-containing protein n=1 Tax=Oryza punctata TaxID=4537 RepID=A0A0E0LYK9_ORYPU
MAARSSGDGCNAAAWCCCLEKAALMLCSTSLKSPAVGTGGGREEEPAPGKKGRRRRGVTGGARGCIYRRQLRQIRREAAAALRAEATGGTGGCSGGAPARAYAELELSLSTSIFGKHVFEAVGKTCPNLKHFRLSEHVFYSSKDNGSKDDEALGIATMAQLRSVQIFGNNLTNEGLTAILDNCPHLESLDIRHCFNVAMADDDTLQEKCVRIKALRLPNDSTVTTNFRYRAMFEWIASG